MRQAVLTGEAARIACAKRRVIAAAAFRDVVEQTGEIQDFAPLEIGDEPRTQRIFVRVLRLGEAAQVADHHQDVLVDGVHVKEIVLHLTHDAPEHRQVLAEDAEQVHPPQFVQQAALGTEHRHEARTVGGIAPESAVDELAVAPQRTQRARRHSLQLAVLLQREKGIEHRRGTPHEEAAHRACPAIRRPAETPHRSAPAASPPDTGTRAGSAAGSC